MSALDNPAVSTEDITPQALDLLGLSREGWELFFKEKGLPVFRGRQVFQWLHQHRVTKWADMTNLSKDLRADLESYGEIPEFECIKDHKASCGTRKWLLKLGSSAIETVLIPEKNRATLCISSQVGCLLDCKFCATGKQGFNRNLSSAEIIGQLWHVQRELDREGLGQRVSNVVMMGMGEPLLNVENVFTALSIMRDDLAYGLSKRRVTVSTSGIVPAMKRLSEECDVSLALSLHAPTDELRSQIVPINKKYPLSEVMAVCHEYVKGGHSKRHVTIEYVMLDGVNDSPQQAKAMLRLLAGLPCKVNLIPFNPFTGTEYVRSSDQTIETFRDILKRGGLIATIRRTRGDDIDAACGQLAGQVNDKTHRQARWIAKLPVQDSNPAVN